MTISEHIDKSYYGSSSTVYVPSPEGWQLTLEDSDLLETVFVEEQKTTELGPTGELLREIGLSSNYYHSEYDIGSMNSVIKLAEGEVGELADSAKELF